MVQEPQTYAFVHWFDFDDPKSILSGQRFLHDRSANVHEETLWKMAPLVRVEQEDDDRCYPMVKGDRVKFVLSNIGKKEAAIDKLTLKFSSLSPDPKGHAKSPFCSRADNEPMPATTEPRPSQKRVSNLQPWSSAHTSYGQVWFLEFSDDVSTKNHEAVLEYPGWYQKTLSFTAKQKSPSADPNYLPIHYRYDPQWRVGDGGTGCSGGNRGTRPRNSPL